MSNILHQKYAVDLARGGCLHRIRFQKHWYKRDGETAQMLLLLYVGRFEERQKKASV